MNEYDPLDYVMEDYPSPEREDALDEAECNYSEYAQLTRKLGPLADMI